MSGALMRCLRDESGQGMVEYALIIGGIALVVLLALGSIGNALDSFISGLGERFGDMWR